MLCLAAPTFGGGILELLTKGKSCGHLFLKPLPRFGRANHVWLIFGCGYSVCWFSECFTLPFLTALHIPVLLVLIGIIFRGSAFTFRHYDIDQATPKAIYSAVFQYSSLFTTFFLGVTLGGIYFRQHNTRL